MIPTMFEWGDAGELFKPADEVRLICIAIGIGDIGEFGKMAAIQHADGCLELGNIGE